MPPDPSAPPALTADQILAAPDVQTEAVAVPEWGGTVYVRTLTAADRDAYDAALFDDDGKPVRKHWRTRLVLLACCDVAGKPLFTAAQLDRLAAKGDRPIQRVYAAAARLNKVRGGDVDDEKKGSAGGPTAASPSASPSPSGTPT